MTETAINEATENIKAIETTSNELLNDNTFSDALENAHKDLAKKMSQEKELTNPDEKTREGIKNASNKLASATHVPVKQ